MVWKAKRIFVWLQDDNGLPTRPRHLRVAYHVPEPEKLKYVISNAPENTSIETLLLAAARLAPIWARGGRCSRRRAEWIGRQALRTQQRNARSDRGRRQAARRRLHGIGVCLSDLRTRQWKPS